MEHRQITLAKGNFRMIDEGAGYLEGYPTMFCDLDEYGDTVLPGAYAATIADFLQSGFNANAHNWDSPIGYPVEAREDSVGLYSKMAFHSTPDAQMVRTKAMERMAAGLDVPLSIGFEVTASDIILPDKYDEVLPAIFRQDKTTELMARARKMPKVRVVRAIKLYEYSPVTAPGLKSAKAVSVRSMNTEKRSVYLGDDIEEAVSISALQRLNDRLFYYALYGILCDEEMTPAEKSTAARAAMQEFTDIGGNLVEAILSSQADTEDVTEDAAEIQMASAKQLRELFADPMAQAYAEHRLELQFARALETAVNAAKRAVSHSASRREIRAAEGRKLGPNTESQLTELRLQIDGLLGEESRAESPVGADATTEQGTPAVSLQEDSELELRLAQARYDLALLEMQGV